MILQPKMAINFRSIEEREILTKVAQRYNINCVDIGDYDEGRAYICPEGYHGSTVVRIEIWEDPDRKCDCDEDDPFEWVYLEAADILCNLLIAERRKNAVST